MLSKMIFAIVMVCFSMQLAVAKPRKRAEKKIKKSNSNEVKRFHVYGAMNLGRKFDEVAEGDNDATTYSIVNFERPGFGLGVDYDLDIRLLWDELYWRVGIYHEFNRESWQVSQFSTSGAGGSTGVTRESEVEYQATILSFTGMLYRENGWDLLAGLNYTNMNSSGSDQLKDYEAKNDWGLHGGVGYEYDGLRYQFIYRYLTHETKGDNGYEGYLNLSSYLITIGKYF
ncbi:MAG: hypothetical protein CME62_00925 [Halobacteriovoraceae bacterium]|nr:hypothetical protein [Halobacteriovoraceae bacterium]